MANTPNPEEFLTNLKVSMDGVDPNLIQEFSVNEVTMTESLLTPGLQTTLSVQSRINTEIVKNLSKFNNIDAKITVDRPIIEALYGDKIRPDGGNYVSSMQTTQRIYRLSNRRLVNYQLEEFQLELCDPSLLKDASTFVTKSWGCVTPSEIVRDVLRQCVGTTAVDIEDNVGPRKRYFATGIHPFQVITQQEEMALAGGKLDPSLVHFMTYQNRKSESIPTHNFRSLTNMAQQNEVFEFFYSGKNSNPYNYAIPSEIMTYNFPCDFDALSDTLNGIDISGKKYSSISGINPQTSAVSLFSSEEGNMPSSSPCGMPPWYSLTNLGSAMDDCTSIDPGSYLPRRKARMGLLDQDKVALRITVPFNPNLNAGRVIFIKIPNTNPNADGEENQWNFGTGRYLIASMTHNIKMGGFGTTTIDCVSNTVAAGVQ